MSADDTLIHLSWFPDDGSTRKGPALGDPETTTVENFYGIVTGHRRHGLKNGPAFCAARLKLEDDGSHVRRVRENVIARTAIVFDIERGKKSGKLPPLPDEIAGKIRSLGLSAVIWTSHSHNPPNDIRYRVVLPLSAEIDHDIPAVELIAKDLCLWDVLDQSKLHAASLFYLPSCPGDDEADWHHEFVIQGRVIDATQLSHRAKALQDAKEAEATRAAAEAHAQTAARRAEILAAGGDPDDSLIEKLRPKLGSLDAILTSRGYDKRGSGTTAKYRHGASQSGSYGADIKDYAGIERIYSHNAGDPLHAGNLPSWCSVTAIDAFDVVTILDHGGDRKRALHELAGRFGLSKTDEKRKVAAFIHRLIRLRTPVDTLRARSFADGERLGLTNDEVKGVAASIAAKRQQEKEAA